MQERDAEMARADGAERAAQTLREQLNASTTRGKRQRPIRPKRKGGGDPKGAGDDKVSEPVTGGPGPESVSEPVTGDEESASESESTDPGSDTESKGEDFTGVKYTGKRYALGAMLTSAQDQVIQNSVRRHGLRYISRFFTVYVYTGPAPDNVEDKILSPGETTDIRKLFEAKVAGVGGAGASTNNIAYPSAHVITDSDDGEVIVAVMFPDERANAIWCAFGAGEAKLPQPLPDPVKFRRRRGVDPKSIATAIGRGVARPDGPRGKRWVNVFISISECFKT